MYMPKLFEETRAEVMHALVRAHPFATLIAVHDGDVSVNHLPMALSVASDGDLGVLRGFVC